MRESRPIAAANHRLTMPLASDTRLYRENDLSPGSPVIQDTFCCGLQSGIDGFKIEGRRKGIHYLAAVIKAYRCAMDRYLEAPDDYQLPPDCWEEIQKVSNREYTSGFLEGAAMGSICLDENRPNQRSTLAGVIRDSGKNGWASIEVRSRLLVGDTLEQMGPAFPNPVFSLSAMKTLDEEECREAHEGDQVRVRLPCRAEPGDLLRKRIA